MKEGITEGLKLLSQVFKLIERVFVPIICDQIDNSLQFGFIQGHATTDAFVRLPQMQECLYKKVYLL